MIKGGSYQKQTSSVVSDTSCKNFIPGLRKGKYHFHTGKFLPLLGHGIFSRHCICRLFVVGKVQEIAHIDDCTRFENCIQGIQEWDKPTFHQRFPHSAMEEPLVGTRSCSAGEVHYHSGLIPTPHIHLQPGGKPTTV